MKRMDLELLMPVLFRWLHVGAAIVTIGGMFFMRAVLMPSAEAALSDEDLQWNIPEALARYLSDENFERWNRATVEGR
ncbi:MAG: hypothetical protein IID33_17625 [Planctomycetes bacterium]|nr:hypothetical protein [Planctomycetota bacterium]